MQKDALQAPPEPPRRRLAGAAILVVSLAAIGWLTLEPMPGTPSLPATCFVCGPLGGVDFILNVVLFLPIGAGMAVLGWRVRHALLVGFGLSLVIECLQWRVIPGRDASLGDLCSNSLGAFFGSLLIPRLLLWSAARGREALSLARTAAAIAVLVVVVSAFLVAPARPPFRQWVLWTANRPNMDPFPGTLLQADVNGRVVRGGDILAPDMVFGAAERSTRVGAAVRTNGTVTRRKAHIVAAANPLQESFFLGQWKDALVFRGYVNGSRLRLRPLLVRLPGAFARAPSEGSPARLQLDAVSSARAITLSASGDGGSATAVLRRTAGLAWTLLLPWDVAIDASSWPMNMLFFGVLALPVAFWSARVPDESRRAPWVPAAALVASVAVAPWLAGIATTTPREWTGAGAGAILGIVLDRLTRRTRA